MTYFKNWLIACVFLFLHSLAFASHIRSVDIQWSVPDPVGKPLEVQLIVTQVGRASYWGSTTTETFQVNIRNSAMTSISNIIVNLSKVGAGVDAANGSGSYDGNYIVFRGTAMVTLPALGSYQASASGCCTASNMANNNRDWDYGSVAKIVLDGQRGGPIAAVEPIINLTRGSLQTVRFPMLDPDGDPVTCRFATSAEAFNLPTPTPIIGSSQATISTVGNECELSWDLSAVTADSFHFLPLIIESTHNGQVSSIGVDRMLLVTNKAYPTCTGGGYIGLQPNQVFSTQFVGTAASNMSFAVTGAPVGSTFNPASGASGASPMPVNFSWTPTPSQAGSSYIMQTVFKDASNVEGQCNYVVNVDALNPVLSLAATADVPNGTAAQLAGQVSNRASGTVQITLTDALGQTHLVPATITPVGSWQALSPANLPVGAVQVSVALDGFAVLPATGAFEVLAVAPAISGVAPNGQVGSVYSFTPNHGPANVTLPVAFALSGTLPNGLSFNTSTGAVTGTPTVAGSFPISLEASNVKGAMGLVLTLTITETGTITTLTLPAGMTVGQPASFAVQVLVPAGVPTGSVLVSAGAETCTASLSAGVGNCQFTPSNAGSSVPFTAVYSGDANALSSQTTAMAAVAKAAQAISFTSAVQAGMKVGDVYNVAATGGLSGNGIVFSIDASTAANCTIVGSTVTFNNAGNCSINANQLGNANFDDAPQVQQVVAVAPSGSGFTITSSANPSSPGQSVSFTVSVALDASAKAAVQKAAPVATGTIELVDGSTSLGVATLVDGSATVSTAALNTVGDHSLVARYSGDANYLAQSSPVFTQTVAAAVATPVPTLNQWAVALLSLGLAAFAAMGMRRSRMR